MFKGRLDFFFSWCYFKSGISLQFFTELFLKWNQRNFAKLSFLSSLIKHSEADVDDVFIQQKIQHVTMDLNKNGAFCSAHKNSVRIKLKNIPAQVWH